MTKWVYKFNEGNADMRALLGGKGANLAEMTVLGMPIPQGFTVTTARHTTTPPRTTKAAGTNVREKPLTTARSVVKTSLSSPYTIR